MTHFKVFHKCGFPFVGKPFFAAGSFAGTIRILQGQKVTTMAPMQITMEEAQAKSNILSRVSLRPDEPEPC